MSVVCHLVPGRRPPSRSCRPRRRQGNRRVGCRTPRRLHHAYRSGLRCGAPPCFDGTVSCRAHPISLPSWASDGVSGPARPWRWSGGHTSLLELLRLRRCRAAQRLQRRALATHHDLSRTPVGDVAWDVTIPVRQGHPSRTLQSGRVPAAWIGPFPCRGAGRRPRRLATADRCWSARRSLPRVHPIGGDRPCPWHYSLGQRSRHTTALSR